MRDLLTVLGIDKVTVVGHSFGGGVAMQFAYQFPERTERMMLVAPGGLGPEVSPSIRAITTPGFHQVMSVLTLPGVRHVGMAGLRALSGSPTARSPATSTRSPTSSTRSRTRRARHAIRHVVRAVVDWRGPDRDDGRPRLPHRGDADVRDLGRDDAVIPVEPRQTTPARSRRRPGSR